MNKAVAFAMCLFSSSFLLGSYDCSAATIVSASQQTPSNEEGDTETSPKTFGTGDNTVTLTKSEDGKTLTVSGKGDLTKIEPAYKFVSTLPTDLFKNDDNHSKVEASSDYSSEVTYQTRAAVYTKIDDFEATYTEKRTHYYFTEAGAKKYYTRKQTSWTDNPTFEYTLVNKGDEINKTEYVDGGTKTAYFTKNEGETEGYTRVDQLSTITNNTTEAESKEITHLKGMTDVFYSSDATNYHQAYNDAVYDETTTYYKRSWNYTTISFDALLAGGYLTNESALVKYLWANNAVENVVFKNEGSDALYIDNDIVKAILYKVEQKNQYNVEKTANKTITTLDLGAATCKNFSQKTFEKIEGLYQLPTNLANVTLPLSEDKTVPYMVLEAIREDNGSAIVKNIIIPEGYTAIADEAFINLSKAETIKFANTITTIGKKAFYGTGFAILELPTSLETIGDDAFNSSTVKNVTFPESLRTISKGAFALCAKLDEINLNEGLEIIGNSAFYLSSKNDNSKVLSIPASVKYVGPAAFNFRWYSDVYYYGEKAPLSPYGVSYINADVSSSAFGSQLLCGNGGFSPMAIEGTTAGDISTGYANRENYINGETYIAVLHFRGDISDKNAETFTDITRKYERWLTEKKKDDGIGTGEYYWYNEDHKTVGSEETAPSFNNYGPGVAKVITPGFQDTALGEQLIWPSQAQFMRSYAVNSNGVKWDGVTLYDSGLTDDDVKLIHEQEQGVNKSTLAEADKTALNKVAYLGTRQFVLISRDVKGDKKDEYPIDITEGKRWWTLCVPCDLTKAQVDEIFGENTHLCLFSKVVRKVDQTNGNEIHLFFQNDTYKNHYERANTGKWTKGAAVSGDDEVVLYAHTPYMIYPTKTPEKEFNGKKVFILTNYTIQSGGALPTVVTSVSGADEDPESYQAVNYVFVGNYRSRINANEDGSVDDASTEIEAQPVTIPQYSYVFGKKGNGNSQFWFYTGTKGTWGVNKCLVEREDDQNNMQEYTTFFGGSSSTSNVSQASFFGDDDVTAIDRVIYHYGDQSTAAIYNINGQMVRADGDRTGLAKGLYIQGGRKFVVR